MTPEALQKHNFTHRQDEAHTAAGMRFPNGNHPSIEPNGDISRIGKHQNPEDGFPTGLTLHILDLRPKDHYKGELTYSPRYRLNRVKIEDGLKAPKGTTYANGEAKPYYVEPSFYKRPAVPSSKAGFNIPIFQASNHVGSHTHRVDAVKRQEIRQRLAEEAAKKASKEAVEATIPYSVAPEKQHTNGNGYSNGVHSNESLAKVI